MVTNEDIMPVRSDIVDGSPKGSSKHLSGASSGGASASPGSGGALGKALRPGLISPNRLAAPPSPRDGCTSQDLSALLSQGGTLVEAPKEVRKPFLAVYVAFSMPLPASILKDMIGHINTLLMVSDICDMSDINTLLMVSDMRTSYSCTTTSQLIGCHRIPLIWTPIKLASRSCQVMALCIYDASRAVLRGLGP